MMAETCVERRSIRENARRRGELARARLGPGVGRLGGYGGLGRDGVQATVENHLNQRALATQNMLAFMHPGSMVCIRLVSHCQTIPASACPVINTSKHAGLSTCALFLTDLKLHADLWCIPLHGWQPISRVLGVP